MVYDKVMYFDLLLLFVVIFFAAKGFLHGFLRQILSLAAIVCIIFLAQPLAQWLKTDSPFTWTSQVPTFILWAFNAFVIFLFFNILSAVLSPLQKAALLKPTDRWLGFAVGLGKGFVFAIVISTFFLILPQKTRARFKDIHADSKDSKFLMVSSNVLKWDTVSTIKGMRKIHAYLKPNFQFYKIPASEPWLAESRSDKD